MLNLMDDRLTALLADIQRADKLAGPDLSRAQRRTAWLAEASGEQVVEFLDAVALAASDLTQQGSELLTATIAAVVRSDHEPFADAAQRAAWSRSVELLYTALNPNSPVRAASLGWLAKRGSDEELAILTRLLVADPPQSDSDVVRALAPLFQRRNLPADALFPALFEALAHPQLAAPVLDLANYLFRERMVAKHPAADRAAQLASLLGEVVQSLARLAEDPQSTGLSPVEISRRVASSVALAVSLCDALALLGERTAIGKLHQALTLAHRRVRTEAAAALIKLGDDAGATELVNLAEEPVARLRVLAYAKELGLLGKIDPQWQTPVARAEAELAVWLAEPTQFGIPPAAIELFDEREQFWPGYAKPIDCFLFRFTYAITIEGEGERSFSNIGIAGPLTHAFLADLTDLSPDDIYAAFAGWQAEHEEIREYDVARLSKSERLEAERLVRRLHDAGYTAIEPQRMGYFFGEKALVALARHGGLAGVAVVDFQEITFFPERHSQRPLEATECFSIYKGRRLLRSFNR
jgi:hypothetical protein